MQTLSMDVVARYKELGFAIHPCCPPNHKCSSPGKVPYEPHEHRHAKDWLTYHERLSDSDWGSLFDLEVPFNIGFMCGEKSRLVCIDIDNDGGWKVLNEISENEQHYTWQFRTGNGRRILYRLPTNTGFKSLVLSDSDGNSLEILGDGKQSVSPPSIHPNGNTYAWIDGFRPSEIEIEDAPTWLLDLSATEISSGETINWVDYLDTEITRGGRNDKLTKVVGHLMSPGSIPPEEAYWWLSMYNDTRCNPKLPDSDIKTIVASIYRRESVHIQHRERQQKIAALMEQYGYTKQQATAYLDSMAD